VSDATHSGAIWSLAPTPAAASVLVEAGYPPWMGSILARRGIESAAQAESFLAPRISDLSDPGLLNNLPRAVERLCRARANKEKIAIVGDYDVDGISATAILLAVFRHCDIETAAILPNRFETGYGFQPAHVEHAIDLDCKLIVTADCGSSATEALAAARESSLDVIITDHHLSSDRLPEWVIEINPKQQEAGNAFHDLAGSGVALKLAVALMQELEIPVRLDPLLRIACLGTICDLVPLQGENRIIVSLGLEALAQTRSRGLRALIDRAGVRPPFRAPDIGFRIGPRINAAGRLADPGPALELLMTRDQAVANKISARLEELNRQRQVEESHVVDEAVSLFSSAPELPPILVAWDDSWHRGVVGIAAGRLSRRFHRPAILMAVEEGLATGSGRSIPGIHLHAFLEGWAEEFVRFGGHAQAIGLTLAEADLERMRREWIDGARQQWSADTLRKKREYELELEPARLTMALLEELEKLEPFGMSNREPVIRVGPLQIEQSIRRFGRGHISAVARGGDGASIGLLGWGWQEREEELSNTFEVLGCLELDRYRRQPTLRLIDARPWSG